MKVLTTFLVLALLGSAAAQGPTRLTLDQAIQLALVHSPALKATRSQLPQSQAQEVTAHLRPNPTLAWDTQFLPLFHPSQFTSEILNDQAQWDMGVGYLFERGSKRQRRYQAAQAATAVTQSQVADAERMLALTVAQDFVAVLQAESNLALAQDNLNSFQQTVTISEQRFQAGDISEADYLKIKLQLLQFQTDVSTAMLDRAQALIALRQQIGYEAVPADYDVAGDLTYQPVSSSLDDLKAAALRDRPDLAAAQRAIKAAQAQYQLARANSKQDLSTTFNFSHVAGTSTGAFFFNIPLPVFDRNQGEIARTRFVIDQSQAQAIAANETVLSDVSNAFEAVRSNEQVVKLYVSGYLNAAQQSREITQYAYQKGAATLLDLLDAERSYRATQLAYRDALASYMTAVEQLRAAIGTRSLP
ncbi:MAG TPA: TolC family protein [Terriglobales bacterium]|nr:TolC family protein [Terriglobales bacterium]